MNRRELVLKKLHDLPDAEVEDALRQLTHHVQARLRFRSLADRTKSGAHGEKNLGMKAVDHYVGEAVKRLFDPNGWDWKFEKFTLAQQLMRIANKLISDKVKDYKAKADELPKFEEKDTSDIYDLQTIAGSNTEGNEEVYAKLVALALEISQDDDDLHYFTMRYFEDASFALIAEEMNVPIEKIYGLRKKLVRRLSPHKATLTT